MRTSTARSFALGLWVALLAVALPTPSGAQPTLDAHELRFRVHQNLIDANGLPFYQTAIANALRDAQLLLEGEQGPLDAPCCGSVEAFSITAYSGLDASQPADDLEIIHFDDDFIFLNSIAGGLPTVFFADSLSECGGSAVAIGCAELPSCEPSSPRFVAVVTTDALESDLLGAVIVHERGHNACLTHVTNNICELMQPTAGGGCLSTSECSTFRGAATTTSGSCDCHVDTTTSDPDGVVCDDGGSSGVCSGGVCDPIGGAASVRLWAAADTSFTGFDGDVANAIYDAGVRVSGSPGDWVDELTIGSGLRPTGLAYSSDSGILYAIAPAGGGDATLAEIDIATGNVTSDTTVSGRVGVTSLAFRPGPTSSPSDDVLYAGERAGGFDSIIQIDPLTGVASQLCIVFFDDSTNGFSQGLAYDAANDLLYMLGLAGLFTVDIENPFLSGDGPACFTDKILYPSVAGTFARDAAGLAWSAETTTLFLVGNQQAPPEPMMPPQAYTLFDSIDTSSGILDHASLGIDGLTVGGLAALPIPEPGAGLIGMLAVLALSVLRRWPVQG